MAYKRQLDLLKILEKKSFFLMGPRSTGKSFLIKNTLEKSILKINLNNTDIYLRLLQEPSLLIDMIQSQKSKYVVIDEIQKIPMLLDEVHNLIEDENIKFILTGSSARKLKRGQANMLGGRAAMINMHPLSYSEITKFNLKKYLNVGGIPRIYDSNDPDLELDAYVGTYLEEEIKAEVQIRNLAPFARFLKTAALHNSELLNYTNIGSDCGLSANTVREYYTVLQDTLIGTLLEPWLESKKRKAIQTAKFYFFDCGVARVLKGLSRIEENSADFGQALEHFILLEIKAYISYRQKRNKIYFWRNTSKHEVDFIIDNEIAIEVKASNKISEKHVLGLRALKEEKIIKKYYVVSQDKINRKTNDGFELIYWQNFLDVLWTGQIF